MGKLAEGFTEISLTEPGVLLLYSLQKVGKTTLACMLPDHYILGTEARALKYHRHRGVYCPNARAFVEQLDLIESDDDFKVKFLVVDTVTTLDEWAEYIGTIRYMNTTQGKAFNRVGEQANGPKIMPGQPGFNSVHSIPNGFGFRWSREVMMEWFKRFEKLVEDGKVEHVILMAHVKDKLLVSKSGETVQSVDINLTGKVKNLWAAKADAVGYMYADDSKRMVSFKTSSREKVLSGPRSHYLSDKTLEISDRDDKGKVKANWEVIYPSLKSKKAA